MNLDEARNAVASLQSCFPQTKLPPSTVVMWANLLSEPSKGFAHQDAVGASHSLAFSSRRMPSLREFTDAIVEARYSRLSSQQLGELPGESHEQLLAAMKAGRSPVDDFIPDWSGKGDC